MPRSELIPIVLKAWKELPDGVHEDFHGHRIVKLPKVLLVTPRLDEWREMVHYAEVALRTGYRPPHDPIKILAFPRPEHIEVFVGAANGVRAGGPGYKHSGSIGTLEIEREEFGPSDFFLSFAQSHFIAGKGEHCLPRSLATKYAGWRKHALHDALKILHEERVSLGVPLSVLYRGSTRNKSRFHKEVIDLSKATGFNLEERFEWPDPQVTLRHPNQRSL